MEKPREDIKENESIDMEREREREREKKKGVKGADLVEAHQRALEAFRTRIVLHLGCLHAS